MSAAELAGRLLDHLRAELGEPALDYAEPPTPISGGFDTQIFAFRLKGAPAAFAPPLILRLLGPRHDARRALRERAVQNAVAGLGYPAPRVLSASIDAARLGGGFLIMERLAGRPMLDVRPFNIAGVLVEAQLRLHALDAEVLLDAVEREPRDMITFGALLADLGRRVAGRPLEGLQRAMEWLLAHRPPEPARRAICHGDFHPQNILMAGGNVTGVLDWPNAVVADPAYDVAATRTILSLTPVELFAVPGPLRWLVRIARAILVARYLAGYRRRRPVDRGTLAYYEAASCMRQLVRVAEARQAAAGRAGALNPLDASPFGERLGARFAELTGVTPSLPAVRP